jgi:hypothetical protein
VYEKTIYGKDPYVPAQLDRYSTRPFQFAEYKPGFLNREILPNENPVSLYQINDYTD